ncbi:MAG TPA: hypothetical protein VK034_25860 [Enhygromyxa sp.]|nr:hypothetical protein [Enhygromyxa sp.]
MLPTRIRVVPLTALALACARADATAPSASEPSPPQPAVTPTEPDDDSVGKVCEHAWALLSSEAAAAGQAVDFEVFRDSCVPGLEEHRRSIGEHEYQRRVACLLAAGNLADLGACDPAFGPPPPARESASFPDGALVRPLSEVNEQAIYTPDPDNKALQQTKAARFDKADGVSVVAFCVETNGATSDIQTVQKFPGDPLIDKIIRDTVAGWRFRPFIVDGAAVKVCTEKRFVLRFR